MLIRNVLKMFGGMKKIMLTVGLKKISRSFVSLRVLADVRSGIQNIDTKIFQKTVGGRMSKSPEVKNIEWSETRPGIYKVNCLGCGKSVQFVGPDISPHSVMMSAREAGWVIARSKDQTQLRLYCSTSCAEKKGGEKLGAQVGIKKATGSVVLEDGRRIQLGGSSKKATEDKTKKAKKQRASKT
jgi:hypothetical protein